MKSKEDGFIARIVLIVVALIAIKYYFDFDIIEWIKSPEGQKIIEPIWSYIKTTYDWVKSIF